MFDDRRSPGDRRKRHSPDGIPSGGCRRHGERRDFFRQYHAAPWWLLTNYAEELPSIRDGHKGQEREEPRAHPTPGGKTPEDSGRH